MIVTVNGKSIMTVWPATIKVRVLKMKRRKFIESITATSVALSLMQFESLLAAVGFQEEGPYNGPLLTSYINSTCGACPGGCGIRVKKIDGIPVKIDGNTMHPINRGGMCPVGVSSLAFLVHPDRIKQPLKRTGPKGTGEFTPISWNEATDLILNNLNEIRDSGRPEQLLMVDARAKGVGVDLFEKFASDFGSPNFYRYINQREAVAASVWGGEGSHFNYDLENAKSIFCFGLPAFESGKNPVYFAGLRNRLLNRSEGEKGKFIIIDPRLSASAAKAEQWVPIKPNSYGLLALGMIYLIIKEKLYDTDAINKYFVGFNDSTSRGQTVEGFKSFVLKNYYPSKVSDGTGVPVDQIITLARTFATNSGAIAISGNNACSSVDSIFQTWAIMALNILSGKYGKDGGIVDSVTYPLKELQTKKIAVEALVSASSGDFQFSSGIGEIESLPDKILSAAPYPVKMAIINNVNLVYNSSQPNRFRQALQNIPLTIVFSSLHNETTALADLLLPDCTFLEKRDLIIPDSDISNPVISVMQPVIKPLFESRQSEEVLTGIGKTLFGNKWKWNNYQAYLEDRAREIYNSNQGTLFSDQFKVSFESLLAERGWRRQEYSNYGDFLKQFFKSGGWWNPIVEQDSEKSRFPTMSGKFYLNSKTLKQKYRGKDQSLEELMTKAGLDLKNQSGATLGAFRNFDHDKESQFPLDLYLIELTTFRGDGGRLRNMADMGGYYQYIKWQSWVELNPETAHELGLKDKQKVWVESSSGKQHLTLLFNQGLIPNVAAIPIGMGKEGTYKFGKNINSILTLKKDFLTGVPAKSETRVKIYV